MKTRKYLIASVGLTIIPIVIVGAIFHVGLIYLAVAVMSTLVTTTYLGKCLHPSSRTTGKSFWIFILLSLIFVGGAVNFAFVFVDEGWRWSDLLYFIFPSIMVPHLLWFAFKCQRKGSASGANGAHSDVVVDR